MAQQDKPQPDIAAVFGGHGITCIPASDEAPSGWGEPVTSANFPLGTPGGTKPQNLIRGSLNEPKLVRRRGWGFWNNMGRCTYATPDGKIALVAWNPGVDWSQSYSPGNPPTSRPSEIYRRNKKIGKVPNGLVKAMAIYTEDGKKYLWCLAFPMGPMVYDSTVPTWRPHIGIYSEVTSWVCPYGSVLKDEDWLLLGTSPVSQDSLYLYMHINQTADECILVQKHGYTRFFNRTLTNPVYTQYPTSFSEFSDEVIPYHITGTTPPHPPQDGSGSYTEQESKSSIRLQSSYTQYADTYYEGDLVKHATITKTVSFSYSHVISKVNDWVQAGPILTVNYTTSDVEQLSQYSLIQYRFDGQVVQSSLDELNWTIQYDEDGSYQHDGNTTYNQTSSSSSSVTQTYTADGGLASVLQTEVGPAWLFLRAGAYTSLNGGPIGSPGGETRYQYRIIVATKHGQSVLQNLSPLITSNPTDVTRNFFEPTSTGTRYVDNGAYGGVSSLPIWPRVVESMDVFEFFNCDTYKDLFFGSFPQVGLSYWDTFGYTLPLEQHMTGVFYTQMPGQVDPHAFFGIQGMTNPRYYYVCKF